MHALQERLASLDEKYIIFFRHWARRISLSAFEKYAPNQARASRPSTRRSRPGQQSNPLPPDQPKPKPATGNNKELVMFMDMGVSIQVDWMKHKLRDGTLLSQANPIKLRHEANALRVVSRETAKNAAIYKALADKIEHDGGRTVADVADHSVIGQIEYMIEQRLREPLTIEHQP
jgi:hypothetical protein